MRALTIMALALLVALTALAPAVAQQAGAPPPLPPYRVIVNPRNPVVTVERSFLKDAFLKTNRRWPDGKTIYPADLNPRSDVRSKFSKEMIGRSSSAVRAYWQQRIFSGRDIPPPEFDSDEKVIAYVLKYEGAVGYVSGAAPLGGSKALRVSW
jgi:ABC-type phosphate transport system substrate-binding protein